MTTKTTRPNIDELKEQVAFSSRIIGFRGVTRGYFGHVSARIPGTDRVLIKAKGPDQEALEFAEPKDVITIDIEGGVVEAPEGLQPPNETAMHLAVYRARPEVMSVIHSHPDWVVALTACGLPVIPIFGAYDPPGMRMAASQIPIYPRAVTIIDGRSVEDCTSRTLTAYELARMNYLAYAVGDPEPIDDADIEEYARRQSEGGGRRRRGPGTTGESSFWRYNRKLLARYLGGALDRPRQ